MSFTSNTKQKIKIVKGSINYLVLDEIKNAINGGATIGVFIISSCAIDYLAAFSSGRKSSQGHIAQSYKKFITTYFPPEYAVFADNLYKDLRCGIVHGLSAQNFAFVYDQPDKHLKQWKDGSDIICLNLENFVNDLFYAVDNYLEQLENDESLQGNLIERYDDSSILVVYDEIEQ